MVGSITDPGKACRDRFVSTVTATDTALVSGRVSAQQRQQAPTSAEAPKDNSCCVGLNRPRGEVERFFGFGGVDR